MMSQNFYRLIWLVLLSLISLAARSQSTVTSETRKWIISKNSSLSVKGSTNMSKFSCDISSYEQTDTLVICKTKKGVTLSGNISLNVGSFDCHMPMMTRDLRKTLKEKQFPHLHICFLSLNKFPVLTADPELITGLVDIQLAGVTKRFEVKYQVSIDNEKVIHVIGSRQLNFSDFKLIPPRKIGGIVQTKDQLDVSFNLIVMAMN